MERAKIVESRADRLEIENQYLRWKLAGASTADTLDAAAVHKIPRAWKLSPFQCQILYLLVSRKFVSGDTIAAVIGSTRGSIKVTISRMRQKLSPFGVRIWTIPRVGLCLDERTKEFLRRSYRSGIQEVSHPANGLAHLKLPDDDV
jgi:biotin operon repressor